MSSVDEPGYKLKSLKDLLCSIAALMMNFNYVLIMISFGILVGVYYSFSLHLNETVAEYYIDQSGDHKALLLLILIGAGIAGSLFSGILLDCTKSYKFLLILMNAMSFMFMLIFTTTVQISIWFPVFCLIMLG